VCASILGNKPLKNSTLELQPCKTLWCSTWAECFFLE